MFIVWLLHNFGATLALNYAGILIILKKNDIYLEKKEKKKKHHTIEAYLCRCYIDSVDTLQVSVVISLLFTEQKRRKILNVKHTLHAVSLR